MCYSSGLPRPAQNFAECCKFAPTHLVCHEKADQCTHKCVHAHTYALFNVKLKSISFKQTKEVGFSQILYVYNIGAFLCHLLIICSVFLIYFLFLTTRAKVRSTKGRGDMGGERGEKENTKCTVLQSVHVAISSRLFTFLQFDCPTSFYLQLHLSSLLFKHY